MTVFWTWIKVSFCAHGSCFTVRGSNVMYSLREKEKAYYPEQNDTEVVQPYAAFGPAGHAQVALLIQFGSTCMRKWILLFQRRHVVWRGKKTSENESFIVTWGVTRCMGWYSCWNNLPVISIYCATNKREALLKDNSKIILNNYFLKM